MIRLLPASIAALALAPAAVAQAPATKITFNPDQAGKGSTLSVEVQGDEAFAGRTPRTVSVLVQRGFKLEPKARSVSCSDPDNCPAASRIGSGRAVIVAEGSIFTGGPQEFTAELTLYLAKAQVKGDRAGLVITYREPRTGASGRLVGRVIRLASGPYGYELRTEGLDSTAPSFPGVTARLRSLQFTAGARRTVRIKRKRRRARKVTYHLITNPSTCDGAWENRVRAEFPDGTTAERELTSPCQR